MDPRPAHASGLGAGGGALATPGRDAPFAHRPTLGRGTHDARRARTYDGEAAANANDLRRMAAHLAPSAICTVDHFFHLLVVAAGACSLETSLHGLVFLRPSASRGAVCAEGRCQVNHRRTTRALPRALTVIGLADNGIRRV